MRRVALTFLVFLSLAGVNSAVIAEPAQVVLSAPQPVAIPGGDGNTSAMVSGVKLTLTRDVNTSNQWTTYWELNYDYYNGSFRWENYQELYIDFVDKFGVTLDSHAVVVVTPSLHCRYNRPLRVTAKGTMGFDFRGQDLTIAVSGATPNPRQDHKNHHC